MQTCGADPRGVRVEWRDGGRRTRLVGVTELSRTMGTNPNLALSVPEGLGGGKRAGVRGAWTRRARVGGGCRTGRRTIAAAAASTAPAAGERHPPPQGPQTPPKAPKKRPRHFASSDEEVPPPPRAAQQAQAKAKGKAPPPPNPKPPPCKKGAGTPMGMCQVWGTPGMSLGGRGAKGGPSAN